MTARQESATATPGPAPGWGTASLAILGLTAAAACALVVSEWLFLVTGPSSLRSIPLRESAIVLAQAPLPVILPAWALVLVLLPVSWIGQPLLDTRPASLAVAVPALLLAVTLFLLAENFTYTLFRWNSLSGGVASRWSYALAFIVLWAWVTRSLLGTVLTIPRARRCAWLAVLMPVLAAISMPLARLERRELSAMSPPAAASAPSERLPDVFLFGVDGVQAGRTSLYGYARPTTPFLADWAESAVVYENAFTNSGSTRGSLTSVLSGIHPLHSGIFAAADMMEIGQAFWNLPAVLQAAGYRVDHVGNYGTLHPAIKAAYRQSDEDDEGARGGPEIVIARFERWDLLGAWSGQFIRQSWSRISGRMEHLLFVRRRVNEIGQLVGKRNRGTEKGVRRRYSYTEDHRRVTRLLGLVERNRGPLFLQIHLGSPHGPWFQPGQRRFSAKLKQERAWSPEYYDDVLADSDRLFARFIGSLKRMGRYDHALIVFFSDHGKRHQVNERVPLVIRFPGDSLRGRVRENVQLIDIAPTVLSSIGVPVPGWMDGAPIPPGRVPAGRGIVSVKFERGTFGLTGFDTPEEFRGERHPPTAGLTVCDRHYTMRVDTGETVMVRVPGHSAPCAADPLPIADARELLMRRLSEFGIVTGARNRGR